ncbi:MAG: Manganese transport system membrane protein MntB [Chlamydiae bacterium]|nr:Manganese transport system membrane protein MntB [Chlamydiota bacterium]
MSPYWGATFFDFIPLFFSRIFQLLTGALAWKNLASDEIQIFTLGLISIASALVGTLLVLKRMTMLANALSHTILLGIVIAYILLFLGTGGGMQINFQILIVAALATGILTTLLTQILHQVMKLQEDASIGLVFTTLFALGIVFVTLYTRNAHIGLEVVMGNADALHLNDVKIAFGMALTSALVVTLFFKEWKLICFDTGLATALRYRPALFSYLLMLLTSGTAISAFRAVGVLLFLAFLVGLPLTARFLTHNLRKVLLLASVIGLFCTLFGVALARHFLTVYQMPLSTAGLVVTSIGGVFVIVLIVKPLRKIKKTTEITEATESGLK